MIGAKTTRLTRRGLLASTLALTACGKGAAGPVQRPAHTGPVPLLRDLAPFRIGAAIMAEYFGRPGYDAAAGQHFSQITPDFEMKMEYILQKDGSLRFEGGDRVADFCRAHNQVLHGHNLIWYIDSPPSFQKLEGDRRAFLAAYRRYIQAVSGRYVGLARGWDVINEPIADDGVTVRENIWTRSLGVDGHFIEAFQAVREIDPNAILFLNDYHLELKPEKRKTFLNLIERLLKQGVPIGGIGNQTHIDVDLPAGRITEAMRDVASLGLPVHLSEFDCTFQIEGPSFKSLAQKQEAQLRLYREAMESFVALPERQQYAFTVWGVRDADSWLRTASWVKEKTDQPLLFDDQGQPKETFWTLVDVLQGR